MSYKTRFCLLALLLCSLCFLPPARGADPTIPWNPKFTPAIRQAQALRLARQRLGSAGRHLRCWSATLHSYRKDHTAGEWRLRFTDKHRKNEKEVVVAFRKGRPDATVRVYHGTVAR